MIKLKSKRLLQRIAFKFAVLGAKPKTAKFNHLKTLTPLDRSQYLKTKFHHFLQGLKILTNF
ncbi:hypothetical protein [Campylobacter concisus]|uniref:hypothetical protein n=1 Tax=Campylobacter concisus TaxID=199 RepID=UPI001CB86C18|nr:hypothetical protein [Campylobacter concisus]